VLSSNLPSSDRALELLKESGCSDGLMRHVEAVSKYAVEVAESLADADVALVQIGGLLHDIGRCKTNGIAHGVVGGKLLRSLGVDERVAKIAEKHVGAGITEKEAARLHLARGNYMPETLEEKIVAAVDNLIEGTKRVTIDKAEADFNAKLNGNPAAIRIRSLHDEVFGSAKRSTPARIQSSDHENDSSYAARLRRRK
jgi:uncharacterized protein